MALLELAPQLQVALGAGQTLVVPTAQRAAALRLAFATTQLAAGRRAFPTPEVHSLSGWLRAQPARHATQRPLRRLGASEEWLLWREAVAAAAAHLSAPMVPGLVAAVRQSAALLFEWRIAPRLLRQHGTPEAVLLAESLARIDARLDELSAAGAWHTLNDLALDPPRRVPLFAGFASSTPARRALLDAWERRGTPSRELACDFAPGATAMAQAADPAQELAMVAQWCRERLSVTPTARLLVIIPELRARNGEVRRVFDAALGADSGAYAVEGGQPLLEYAPIAAGLGALQVLTSQVELVQLSQWLRADLWPQIGAAPRAQLDVWLRTVVPPRLQIRQLLRALRAAPPWLLAHADAVAAAIERMLAALGEGPAVPLGQWSARFGRLFAQVELTARAARQRGSQAQQLLQRLDELLQECAALPAALGVFTADAAVDIFRQILARTRFEPATGDAAVTLTSSLSDPILRYDGIWASGLHAGAIPQAARFDPFIPAVLQREAGVLAANAAAQVAQARQALNTLARRSHEFILSAPRRDADLELSASPLLLPFAARTLTMPAAVAEEWPRAMRATRAVEVYEDEAGEPWPRGVPLPAGTRAIELQSRCPFRAYAQLRLRAEPLETPAPGITARERGSMLHRALQLLWQRLRGSAGLAAARAESVLERVIAESIAQAAGEILHAADADQAADATGLLELRRAAIAREHARAQRLIRALCELEAGRAPFAIHELEAEHRLDIADARIALRIDRMDRLQDGTHAILDYKSGRAATPDWEEERTTHPQLLVYLLAAGVPVSALAVAHLDPQAVVFKGIGDADGRLPGVGGLEDADAWTRQRAAWREQVARLGADFMRGEARVDPMDGACEHCHLQSFCRIADTP